MDVHNDKEPLLPSASKEITRASSRRVTVEPVILFASIGFGVLFTLQPQYIKQRLADDRNFTISQTENGCNLSTSDPDYIIEQEIQADVSSWQMIINICGFFPSLFTAPIIGAWGDKVGRKLAIGVPILGYMITMLTYLIVYYCILPLWVLAIGYFLQGTTGGYGLVLAGCYAYVADITTKEKRMLRIVIIQALFVFGMGLSQVLIGLFIRLTGFAPSLWLAALSLTASLAYIVSPPFLVETIRRTKKSRDPDVVASPVADPSRLEAMGQLFRENTDSRRTKLILLLLIAFSTEGVNQASLNITIIYGLGPPFCWNSVVVGFYSALVLFTSAAGKL